MFGRMGVLNGSRTGASNRRACTTSKGAQAVGDAVGHPEADLIGALHRVLPSIRLLEADAEEADDRLLAHGRAEFLAVLAVGPGGRYSATGLPVGDQEGRQLADPLHVEGAQSASAGVGDDAPVR